MPCSHGYLSPRELYEKAIECRDGIFTIFGKTGAELLKAIEFYDQSKQEQIKMTRDEAVKRIGNKVGKHYNPTTILNVVEALGLLKFDEPSKPEMVEWHCEGIVHRYPKGYDPNHSSGLVWIKVADEEDNKPSPSMVIRSKLIDLVNQPMQCADGIVNALYKAGYTISNQKGELKLSKSIYSCGITEGNLKALNASGYEIVYTGVTTSSSTEFLTISVGTHTHTVTLETIIKALNAKGCTVYRNRVEL